MCGRAKKYRRGLSFIEVIVATLVAAMAATGVLSYEYQAARQRKMACVSTCATRIGYFVLQDWKANSASMMYADGNKKRIHNPAWLQIDGTFFERDEKNIYLITVNSIPFRIILSRPVALYFNNPRLIPLKAQVQWKNNFAEFTAGESLQGDPLDQLNKIHTIVLKTYGRVDQEGRV